MNNRLREAREEYGMSITELAKRANVSRQTIHNIELNNHVPSVKTAFVISEVLRMDPRDIFFTDGVIQDLQDDSKQVI